LVLGYFITCPQIQFAILSNAGLSNTQPAGFMWLLHLYDVPCSCFYSYHFIAQNTIHILKNHMQGVFYILTFFYTEKITKEKQVNAT